MSEREVIMTFEKRGDKVLLRKPGLATAIPVVVGETHTSGACSVDVRNGKGGLHLAIFTGHLPDAGRIFHQALRLEDDGVYHVARGVNRKGNPHFLGFCAE